MLRIKIIQEGVRQPNGKTVSPGAFMPDYRHEGQIPVLLNGHFDQIIGFGREFERDEDGWISYDIVFRADFLEEFVTKNLSVTDWYEFSAYATDCKPYTDDRNRIDSGVVRAIYAIPLPGFPRSHIPATMKKATTMPPESPTVVPKPNVDYVGELKGHLVTYINEKLEKTDGLTIDESYIYVVWFAKTLQHAKALFSTTLPDGMYYELTFNGDKDELYIDAYKKFDNVKVNV